MQIYGINFAEREKKCQTVEKMRCFYLLRQGVIFIVLNWFDVVRRFFVRNHRPSEAFFHSLAGVAGNIAAFLSNLFAFFQGLRVGLTLERQFGVNHLVDAFASNLCKPLFYRLGFFGRNGLNDAENAFITN